MNLIEFGDCRDTMRRWAEQGIKAQTCVTSPPYYGLRDYGHEGQIGLGQTLEEYITAMVEVFRCVRDVLADDGTLWLNLGDSYAGSGKGGNPEAGKQATNRGSQGVGVLYGKTVDEQEAERVSMRARFAAESASGLKPKDLIGIPWRVAFALRADGWYLRQDIIWHKPNPMPESVTDRCTKAHEYIFLLSKSARYWYDAEAVAEPMVTGGNGGVFNRKSKHSAIGNQNQGKSYRVSQKLTRNRRSVWTVTTRPYKGAHFATFPPALIEPCILAGSRPGDVVLDPFMGSGTTAAVALQHGRQYLGCELNPEYGVLSDKRIAEATR